jgi:hypothetical protein
LLGVGKIKKWTHVNLKKASARDSQAFAGFLGSRNRRLADGRTLLWRAFSSANAMKSKIH